MIWALVLLLIGLAGAAFVIGYAIALRRKFTRAAEEATLLRERADALGTILDDWQSRRGD